MALGMSDILNPFDGDIFKTIEQGYLECTINEH